MEGYIKANLSEAIEVYQKVLNSSEINSKLSLAIETFVECYQNNHKVFSCGNGGSMCDSMHFAEELTGRFSKDRAPLPAMALNDPSYLTCVINDYGPDVIFSRMIEAWGSKGDVLLAISTSGNSKNVIEAVKMAQVRGLKTVALLGKEGGQLKDMVDVSIIVPSKITHRIQEIHIHFIHTFIEGIERAIFPKNY